MLTDCGELPLLLGGDVAEMQPRSGMKADEGYGAMGTVANWMASFGKRNGMNESSCDENVFSLLTCASCVRKLVSYKGGFVMIAHYKATH